MKKLLIYCLTVAVCLLAVGCSFTGTDRDDGNVSEKEWGKGSEEAVSDEQNDIQNVSVDERSPKEIYDSLTENPSFGFENVEQLKEHFTRDGNYITENSNATLVTNEYDLLAKRISDGEVKIIQPFMNDSALQFRNKEGFSNITLFTNELYERPWIWYYCIYDSQEYQIRVMYLTENEIAVSKTKTTSQFIADIAPNAPNVSNAEQFDYDVIYESTLDFGKVTLTSVNKAKNGKYYITFLWGDALVTIKGNGVELPENFINNFSLNYVTE